ncbi:MAG: alpha-2-macroglobulin [Bacteroidales bacterium]|jgi:uncharacterized protein YfaS (alpha-2-macroglobulin family)|nr:alpha-2-macroglobulin [Bacteroidales bacterium]
MKRFSLCPAGFLSLIFVLTFSSCKEKTRDIVPSTDFAPYISAYTGGIISSNASIYIELTENLQTVEENSEITEKLFSFTPSLKGKTYWVDQKTIQFVPDSGTLKPGTLYNGSFALDKVLPVDKSVANFEFSFRVQERNFTVKVLSTDIALATPDLVTINGEIRLSDVANLETIAKMITAKRGNDNFTPVISGTANPYIYKFEIKDIKKNRRDSHLKIVVNGKPFGASSNIEENISAVIPAKGKFSFLSAEIMETPDRMVVLTFSNPVSPTQQIYGLIEVEGIRHPVQLVKDNKIQLFFTENNFGKSRDISITIDEGLKDLNDNYLDQTTTVTLPVVSQKPSVEFLSAGSILPNSQNLILPFKAVSLNAVDVRVIKIFENNVLLFLQDNKLNDSYMTGLRRSGRLVYKDRIRLDNDPSKNINEWDNYFIDLSKIIAQDPGAIYRVILSFDPSCSAYPCQGETTILGERERLAKYDSKIITEEEDAQWDQTSTYYYEDSERDWSLYDWRERDNPCHPSYYMESSRKATTNVLASNIGVIAKVNATNHTWISVSDILSTQPIANATATIYNFQLQPVGSAKTDRDGFAEIKAKNKPFVLVVESENNKTYLKLNEGEENMLSRFDVGGQQLQKGLKGFIYGERGVWRPGDTLFLSFMLEDRENRIPNDHPVSFELYNPNGQFYLKQVSTSGVNGLYTFKVPTKQDDPTGIWNAYVKIGGTAFHKSLRIETIKPNRLKINIDAPDLITVNMSEVSVNIHANWLTGATARDLKTSLEYSLSKKTMQFKGYERYNFDNPASRFEAGTIDMYEEKLDENGDVTFKVRMPSAQNVPGMLDVNLICRVFEKGGDISIFSKSVPYSPFESYVGLDLKTKNQYDYLETDMEHTFDVVALSDAGKPIKNDEIEYKIYKVNWGWWYEYDSYSVASFLQSRSNTPVQSGKVKISSGKGTIKFELNYPGWGRYFVYVIDRKSGHATGGFVYIDWPSWRGRSNKEDPTALKMITFATDKESYEVNDVVTVFIPASKGGRALVALENGTEVVHREWVVLNENIETKYTFKATEAMSPNVYLHISLLQPHEQVANDLPIRMYGVAPVFVHNKSSKLEPVITSPEVIYPEKEFTVKVSEKNKAPMTYTLAIVDEGLLDITNCKTPDPWNYFYAREALGIKTWDMYDLVIGAHTGTLGSMLSIGGDEGLKRPDPKANRFKPVVKFLGRFTLKKGEEKTHKITLPPYIGSVRIMVVAGQEGAYGNAEKAVPVRSPLMVLASLPRVISTAEKISLPVNIFAMEKEVKNVTVKVQTTGKVKVDGEASQTIAFAQPGDQIVNFMLTSTMLTGMEKITVTATGNGQTATETIEIEVRNPNPPVVNLTNKLLNPGESVEIPYSVNSGSDSWTKMEVSRIPFVDISRRFDFLYNYQHYCTEQLTSRALPLLYILQFKEVDEGEKEMIARNVREAIQSLYARQASNGGFVYWPGMSEPNEWVTAYAGLFLITAKEKGYEVNQNVLNKWKRYQRTTAHGWRTTSNSNNFYYRDQSTQTQAFRLYTLALAGDAERGAMNRMKEMKGLDVQTVWRLAATYALSGNKNVAQELLKDVSLTVSSSSINYHNYGSPVREDAMILETMLLLGRDADAFKQGQRISEMMAKENYFSTQSTAFGLMAMGKLAEKMSGSLKFDWAIDQAKSNSVTSGKTVFQKDLSNKTGNHVVRVKNNGSGIIYVSVVGKYIPQYDTLPAKNNNVKLEVTYEDMNGKAININQLTQGTDLYAVVKVTNISVNSSYRDIALTHIVPSGWEIYNERLFSPQKNSGNTRNYNNSDYEDDYVDVDYYRDPITYQDIRDDLILSYFDLGRGQSVTVRVRLTASYTGEFTLPAIQCEAMYDTEVFARTKAGRVEVRN